MPKTAPVNRPEPPQEQETAARMGPAYPLYRALVESGPFTPEWKYYGAKYGWSLKLFEKKHNLCFIAPQEGAFQVAFVFGDRAVERVLASDCGEASKEELRTGKKYPEGRAVRLTVRSEAELAEVRKLLAVKREK
jgi:hypothetical protein